MATPAGSVILGGPLVPSALARAVPTEELKDAGTRQLFDGNWEKVIDDPVNAGQFIWAVDSYGTVNHSKTVVLNAADIAGLAGAGVSFTEAAPAGKRIIPNRLIISKRGGPLANHPAVADTNLVIIVGPPLSEPLVGTLQTENISYIYRQLLLKKFQRNLFDYGDYDLNISMGDLTFGFGYEKTTWNGETSFAANASIVGAKTALKNWQDATVSLGDISVSFTLLYTII